MTQTVEQIEWTKKVFAFSSDSDLARFLDISSPTLKKWRREKNSVRVSKPNYIFRAVVESLEKLLTKTKATSPQDIYNFFITPRELLAGKSFRQIILQKAKDDDAVELIVFLVESSIKEAKESKSVKQRFRSNFGVVSDDSCRKAAEENPEILIEYLASADDAVEKSMIIEALPYNGDARVIDQIFPYLDDFSPLVRESAVTALHAFAEESEDLSDVVIFPKLKRRREIETSDVIKKSIDEALRCHVFEF